MSPYIIAYNFDLLQLNYYSSKHMYNITNILNTIILTP